MPQYMLLIYTPAEGGPSPAERAEEMPRWGAYTQMLRDTGLFVAGDPLHPAQVATTVRVRDGETQLTDGPFAETKEQLGGYYILDCPDLDAALARAAEAPHIGYGSVEVRPILTMEEMGISQGQAQASGG